MKTQKRTDGTSTIVFRVIIDRRKREFNLNVNWPAQFFDEKRGLALPRHKGDSGFESVNLVINQANSKAHQIKLYYFAREKELTLTTFTREFENYEQRDNFFAYWRRKQQELYNTGVISEATWKRHRVSVDGLQAYYGCELLRMCDINIDLVQNFNVWLRKKLKVQNNTVCGYMKNFKTYINHAISDGFEINNPFKKFKFSFQPGKRSALEATELTKLKKLLIKKTTTPLEKLVLQKFLFSCYTGIRISDSARITADMIDGQGVLNLKMKKGERFGKLVQIPLPKFALQLIKGKKYNLFESVADQTCNDVLKVLAAKAHIEKRLTFHVSRDTFGTLFIELGGDPVTLKDLMGHTNIQTTMIYTKMSEKRKEKLMSNFDKLL